MSGSRASRREGKGGKSGPRGWEGSGAKIMKERQADWNERGRASQGGREETEEIPTVCVPLFLSHFFEGRGV